MGPLIDSPPPALSLHSPTTRSLHRLSIGSQSIPQPSVFPPIASDIGRTHQLPRIRSLEVRDQSSTPTMNLAPAQPVTEHGPNPRRSTTRSPAAFLRNDTSKSSASSTFSNVSAQTPDTPFEVSRNLPPPFTLNSSYDSTATYFRAPSEDSARRPPFGPPSSVFNQPYGISSTENGPGKLIDLTISGSTGSALQNGSGSNWLPEYEQSINRLSLNHPLLTSEGSNQGQNSFTADSRSMPLQSHDIASRSIHPESGVTSSQTAQLDPLSVLALAGRMVERDGQDNAKPP